MKKLLRSVLSLIFVVGVILAVWPLGQKTYGWWSQRSLQAQWQQTVEQETHQPKPLQKKSEAVALQTSQALTPPRAAPAKWPSTQLLIPDIGLDAIVVQGVTDEPLRRGPGHVPDSSLPGAGNCVISAHRNVYGSWFARLNELTPGALIQLKTPGQSYNYRMLYAEVVNDTDLSVLQPPSPGSAPHLTLLTCTIPHSPQRIAVIAEKE